MEKQNRRKKIKNSIIFVLIILFFIDGYKFLNTKGSEHPIAGTLFDKQQRIVYINGLNVDVEPTGHKVFINNTDRPGVIGILGTILGDANINIAGMNVGRKETGKEAITVLEIDGEVSSGVIAKISTIEGIIKVRNVVL